MATFDERVPSTVSAEFVEVVCGNSSPGHVNGKIECILEDS